MVYDAIVFIWVAVHAFEITMALLSTDIMDGVCSPMSVYSSDAVERTEHFLGSFVAYVLPLSLMVFFYSRLVCALRPKVTLRISRLLDPSQRNSVRIKSEQ